MDMNVWKWPNPVVERLVAGTKAEELQTVRKKRFLLERTR